ncbi:hypothetical protein ACE38F_23500 [Bacillus mycoides]
MELTLICVGEENKVKSLRERILSATSYALHVIRSFYFTFKGSYL